MWALQVVQGVASALSVAATAVLVRRILQLERGSLSMSGLLPLVLGFTALGVVSQLASAYHTVNAHIVSEQVSAAALDRILDIVGAVELEAFDDPRFATDCRLPKRKLDSAHGR